MIVDYKDWYEMTAREAGFYCEEAGFICKPFDLWDMETKIFYLKDSDLSFNYKIASSDKIKFMIQPFFEGKQITFDKFKELYKKYEESRKMV